MHTVTVTVGSAVGLHARPAAIIAQEVARLGSEVTIGLPGGDPVNAGSALMIMTLGAHNGAVVEVTGEERSSVESIGALIERDLDS